VLHGDRKPPSVFLVTALVLGRRICIVGECLRGCGGTTLFHHPVKRTTWCAEPVAELWPCRGAALLGGDIAGTGPASFGLAQPHSAVPRCVRPHPRRPRVPRAGESRLEGGGVNRANLKFINLSTTTSRVSVRNINESEREGEKQIVSK
jgi:hypothetical protein